MAGPSIKYKSGYKYQLAEDYELTVSVTPDANIVSDDLEYIKLDTDGKLAIKKGYAWDGPSGPTIDTRSFMRGSLVHDALYQLMRQGSLNRDIWRDEADLELKRLCLEDGMWAMRAWYVQKSVEWFAKDAAEKDSAKVIHEAP